MRLVYVVGVPGSGKSTLVARALEPYRAREEHLGHGMWIRWLSRPEAMIPTGAELGRHRDAFSGTDALGMAVMPRAIECVRGLPVTTVIAEGDRLASMKFLRAARDGGRDVTLVHLDTPEDVAEARRTARGSTQNAAWLRGRATKVARLVDAASDDGIPVVTIDGTAELDKQVAELGLSL